MGSPRIQSRRLLAGVLVLAGAMLAAGPAAAEYVFASPSVSGFKARILARPLYRHGRRLPVSGRRQPAGSMACFPPGEGARVMPSGDYDLKGSNWETEWGVFRLNRTTGEISLCFVKEAEVVCPAGDREMRPAAPRDGDAGSGSRRDRAADRGTPSRAGL